MFCFHKKWSEVKEDGYQYCLKCGKAKAAPLLKCGHEWEIIDTQERILYNIGSENNMGRIYTLQCNVCGDIKKEDHSHYTTHEKMMESYR